jgi:hypothetical protein
VEDSNWEPDGVTLQVRFCEEPGTNRRMAEILWHRRETRRPTENTNFGLNGGKDPAYSPGARLVIATDNDEPGRALAQQIEAIAPEARHEDLAIIRDLPEGDGSDWNDVLRGGPPTLAPEPLPAPQGRAQVHNSRGFSWPAGPTRFIVVLAGATNG